MTRTPYDQFAKQYLSELLAPLGKVETSRNVAGEVREVDVSFAPAPVPTVDAQVLGLLGQMASSACLFEPFRNQPAWTEVRNCLLKLFELNGEVQRQARRERDSLPEEDLPRLWILSPSCSQRLLDGFGAKIDSQGNWPSGVYFLPLANRTALVAINQLPPIEETLLLRLLGSGEIQKQAANEVAALPQGHPLRRNILELLSNLQKNLQARQNLSDEDRELIMNLSPAYLQWREETLQEGSLEGQRLMVQSLLEGRFGAIDEEFSQIVAPLMQLSVRERTQILLELSREELLARFGGETD